jgi:hypothetical protein
MKLLSRVEFSIFLICSLVACGKTIEVQEAVSPDKKYVAIAQVYDWGATTDRAPIVYIRHYPNYKEWWYSNSEEEKVFSGYRSDEIAVEWASEKELVIYCECRNDYLVDTYWGIKIISKYSKFRPTIRSSGTAQKRAAP